MSPKPFPFLSPDLVLKLMMTDDSPNSDGGAEPVTLHDASTSSASSMTSSQASSLSVWRAPQIICSSSVTCNSHTSHTVTSVLQSHNQLKIMPQLLLMLKLSQDLFYIVLYFFIRHAGGHAVAQLVEALRYKPEGRGFDSRWCHWIFLLT